MPLSESMLDVEGLHAGYGGGTVLHGITFRLAAGQVHVVVGANGAGKTTLIHTIAGLHRPIGGQIRLGGREITGAPAYRRARAGIGLVPQGRRNFAGLTVAEHLVLARRTPKDRPAGWDRARILDLLPQLAARLRHRSSQLSGGEQQMLAIARALLTQPRLLLLDEPTEGLAPGLAAQIRDLIATLARERLAILLAAPHPDLALAVASQVSTLTAGRLATTVDVATARADPTLLHAGLGPAGSTPLAAALDPAGGSRRPAWLDLVARPADHTEPAQVGNLETPVPPALGDPPARTRS